MNTRDHEPLTPEERDLAQRLSRLGGHAAPSASLDAKILAAARTAASAPSPAARAHARRRPRWPFGVGVAASLAVALGIAWQLRPQPESAALRVLSEDPARQDAMVLEAPRPAPPSPPVSADDAFDAASTGASPAEAPASPEPARALRAPAPLPDPPMPVAEAAPPDEAPIVFDEAALKHAAAVDDSERRQRSEAVYDVVAPAASAPPAPPAPPPPPPATPAPEPRGFVVSPPPANAGIAAPATAIGTTTQVSRERKAAAQSAAADAATSARPALERIEVTGSRIDRYVEDETPADQPLDDQPPASADSPEVRDAWLKRIRELRTAGQIDEARASLHEFMRRHPGTAVPDDLRVLLGE